MQDDLTPWIGRTVTFNDGLQLRVVSVKDRESGPWVIYEVIANASQPRRFSLKFKEFIHQFGHLFQKP